ncbi:MAG TPA: hypothetical protein VHM70_29555 [Polyangiaceae bacterium]|nr:hypothetical protein [Polyangiaceae bacterium]
MRRVLTSTLLCIVLGGSERSQAEIDTDPSRLRQEVQGPLALDQSPVQIFSGALAPPLDDLNPGRSADRTQDAKLEVISSRAVRVAAAAPTSDDDSQTAPARPTEPWSARQRQNPNELLPPSFTQNDAWTWALAQARVGHPRPAAWVSHKAKVSMPGLRALVPGPRAELGLVPDETSDFAWDSPLLRVLGQRLGVRALDPGTRGPLVSATNAKFDLLQARSGDAAVRGYVGRGPRGTAGTMSFATPYAKLHVDVLPGDLQVQVFLGDLVWPWQDSNK